MGEFRYTAKNGKGEKVSGIVDADSEAGALRLLDERNLFPISVADSAGSMASEKKAPRRRISSRDVGVMYGQLADLIGSGVPLLRSLDSLVKSTVNSRLREVLKEIRAAVADGKSLTNAMREHPVVFPLLHTARVQAGERASFLEDVLRSLASFLERLDELRSKVLGAMIYPALLTGVGLTVLVGALIFFVPRFEPLLSGIHQSFPTRLLFALSHAVRGYWYLILMALAVAAGLLWSGLKSEAGKRWIEEWRLKIPVIGVALRMVAITRFCRILGTMLANGVPMLQALSISKDSTGSPLLADHIADAAENVRAGKALTEPLRAGGLFPEQILAMITVAEESNQLEKVLLHIADTVERRTNRQVDQAVRLVEPLILCAVAAAIGFLALGLLLPIFTMASTLTVK
ncbi:MAG: proteinral secretion pathway protein F [Planctomycetota bacterium]|nr:MAG: proteinral secretion pathway protein F [Planctomycetota bacterium]